jgi:hypothetical protein
MQGEQLHCVSVMERNQPDNRILPRDSAAPPPALPSGSQYAD